MLKSSTSTPVDRTAGAADGNFVTRNAVATVGVGVLATVPTLGTVGMIMGAPGTTALIAAIGGTATYAGYRLDKGESLIPPFGQKEDKSSDTDTPAPAAEAA